MTDSRVEALLRALREIATMSCDFNDGPKDAPCNSPACASCVARAALAGPLPEPASEPPLAGGITPVSTESHNAPASAAAAIGEIPTPREDVAELEVAIRGVLGRFGILGAWTDRESAALSNALVTAALAAPVLSQGAPEPPLELSLKPEVGTPERDAITRVTIPLSEYRLLVAAVSRGPGPDWDHDLPSERELIAAFKPRLAGYLAADVTDEMLGLGLKLGLHALRRVAASPAGESKP